ncbi:MAG: hypothetical protein PHH28_08125 [Desulfuromonadaceae bacterium]|nr:hypothetical protein [Desulfuromonadaceae bacterium]
MHPDHAFQAFVKISDTYAHELTTLNEADTRGKIIDFILRDCLGWSEQLIKRETHTDVGYTDYQLRINNIPIITIEAKRSGMYFDIPTSKNSRNYKINGSISTVDNLTGAMSQVHSYCVETGCKYAAVFNGYQLVIFSAISIGAPWKEGNCIVFNSLDDIRNNFSALWNILSFDAVKSGSLISYLDKSKQLLSFKKVISEIHNPDQSWARNELYIYVQPLCDFIFSELLDEARTDVLKECYVNDKSIKPLTEEIERFFNDKLPHFAHKYKISQIEEDAKSAGQFEKDFKMKVFDKSNGSMMVLLGGVGSGKSTFIHRFFKVIISERENHLWFYIDFRNAPIEIEMIEQYVFDKMYEVWEHKYEDKLNKILTETSFSPKASSGKEFFKALFGLANHIGFSTTVIIDNIDQHDIDFQEKLFLTAHHIKDTLKTVVILALREETFIASTRIGVLDAYHISKFHISSPDFLKMILKRIDFAIKTIKYNTNENYPKEDLSLFFNIIMDSLYRVNSQSKKIAEFINSVSVGNMREALRMFNSFIYSGNTYVEEMFSKYKDSGTYQLSYHQLIKSIMLGEYRHYSQERSHVMNIYDFDYSITDSPFHLLRILKYLLDNANKKSQVGRGFVEIGKIVEVFESISIRKNVVIDSMVRLSGFNLIEYDNQSRTNIDNATYAKLTAAGKYYYEVLCNEFTYLDLVMVDTPLSDDILNNTLIKEIYNNELENRIVKVRMFIDYLEKTEQAEIQSHPEYSFSEVTNNQFVPTAKRKYTEFVDRLQQNHKISANS